MFPLMTSIHLLLPQNVTVWLQTSLSTNLKNLPPLPHGILNDVLRCHFVLMRAVAGFISDGEPALTPPACGYDCAKGLALGKVSCSLCKCAFWRERNKQCNPCDSLLTAPPGVVQVGWCCCHGNNPSNKLVWIRAANPKKEKSKIYIYFFFTAVLNKLLN